MRAITLLKQVIFVAIGVCLMLAVVAQNAQAQVPEGAVSLGISPQLLDLTANPGEVSENSFRLTNASVETLDILTTPKNFVPRGEEGAVDLTVDNTSFSLADWITVTPARVSVEPGTTQDFKVDIRVPENAEPGSHFGSVVFQAVPPEQAGAAALVSQEIAPVILVRVAGDATESVQIEEFTTDKSFYSNESTITLLSRLENTGTVHFKPRGQVTIKNMFGSEVASFDLDRRNVLPDSIRQIPTEWSPEGFQIGRYSATLTLVFGDNDEIRVAETSFTVFPYQTIVPIVIGSALILFIVIKFRKRLMLAAKVLSGKEQASDK